MSKIYLVASGKGGVGKTTVCANLGITYAKEGYNVILIDADIGLNNLDVTLGVEESIKYDLVDVLENRVNFNQALVEIEGINNLRLLASSKVSVPDRVKTPMFINLIKEASLNADVIFIDAPAGIDSGLHRAASAANEAIIVTTPHVSAIKDADRAISVLSTYSLKGMGVVVNRFRKDLFNKGEILDGESIAELLRVPLYGVIPESDKLGVYSTILGYGRDRVKNAYTELKNNIIESSFNKKTMVKKGIIRRLFG